MHHIYLTEQFVHMHCVFHTYQGTLGVPQGSRRGPDWFYSDIVTPGKMIRNNDIALL